MGNCTNSVKRGPKAFQLRPNDLAQFEARRDSLEQLQFQGSLANIKIQNAERLNVVSQVKQKALSLKFQISDFLELPLPVKVTSEAETEIKWKVHEKFVIKANEYEIRMKFLKVSVCDQKFEEITSLKINLYFIINGPYHHDLGVEINKRPIRLIFDCKISQIVKVTVRPEKVQIQLNKQYPGQQFNYSFKFLKHDDSNNALVSQPSETQSVPLNKTNSYRRMSEQQESPSPTKRRKAACKLIKVETTSVVNWEKQKNKEMSDFDISMGISSLMKASIQFILWKNQQHQGQEEICTFFADCYFPFSQFFTEDQSLSKKQAKIEKKTRFEEHLYMNGKVVGEVAFIINVAHKSFYRQSRACARTEDGVVNMTPECKFYSSSKSKNAEIERMSQLVTQICYQNIELNNNMIGNYTICKKIRQEMLALFQQISNNLNLLNRFVKNKTLQQKTELMHDQEKLLQMIQKFYPFIEDEDINFSEQCWKIIVKIIKRPEFYLNGMGFFDQEVQNKKNEQLKKMNEKRIEIGLRYQKIVNKIILIATNFGFSDYRKGSKSVAQQFKAVCYIRVPVFRQLLLQAIVKNSDSDMTEWKFQDLSQQQINNNEILKDVFMERLDWDSYFYQPLKKNQAMAKLLQQLRQILQGNVWLKQVGARKSEFFYFTKCLICRLDELGKQLKLYKWHYLPGYNKIVRTFLIQMKSMNISEYPRSLEIASTFMLTNERLINIQMTILMEKTNCYDVACVIKSLDLLSRYFSFIIQSKNALPVTFNYLYFFKAIKAIIQSSFSYSTTKALVIIYNFFHNFSMEFRQNLMKYLLGKVFFKLFLHWSYSVRNVFHHIILLKLDNQINSNNESQWAIHQVSSKYKHNIKLILKAQEAKKKQQRQNMAKTYEKDLYKILKRKINQKKNFKKINQDQIISPMRKRRGTVCFATPQVSKKQKYQIQQLATRQDPSNDFQLDILALSNFQNRFSERKQNPIIQSASQTMINLRKIESNRNSESFTSESSQLDKTMKKNRVRRFSFYAQEDFELSQIEPNQLPYLSIAANEFREISAAVKKYFSEKGEMPKINLGMELAIDQKDIRPSVADNIQ